MEMGRMSVFGKKNPRDTQQNMCLLDCSFTIVPGPLRFTLKTKTFRGQVPYIICLSVPS